MTPPYDIAIVGAGAAGLSAAIFAGEATAPGARILLLEGARKPGAKILVSGGGRCNVTNVRVKPEDYCGGSRRTIDKVLRVFDEERTRAWMASLGVELKLEPTGKYFPTSDKARTVLDALLARVEELGVEFHTGARVADVAMEQDHFQITLADSATTYSARRLIMATGGLALPKSGSDGAGLGWMERLGHRIVPTTPALAPLVIDPAIGCGAALRELAGLTVEVTLSLHGVGGKKIESHTGSLVFTHFGISGPAAMNLSRHLARHRIDEPHAPAEIRLSHPQFKSPEDADRWLLAQIAESPKRTVANALAMLWPQRLAEVLAEDRGRLGDLAREERLALARRLSGLPLPVSGDRGYTFAETTAGGVDLRDVKVATMESRRVPGLYLCGEILDVDGRIGGFNFQWAWASGHIAGNAAARSINPASPRSA